MSKKLYWMLVGLLVVVIGAVFMASVPAISRILNLEPSHVLAYSFVLIGVSVFYFGFLKPHWFTKEIIPRGSAIKFKVSTKPSMKPSLKDDAYFWNLFPYALFFSFGGLAYLLYPSPTTLWVALVCSAWVKLIYRIV